MTADAHVCPFCRSPIIEVVTVDYIHKVDPATGRMAKRGKRASQHTNLQCSECTAYYSELNGGFVKEG